MKTSLMSFIIVSAAFAGFYEVRAQNEKSVPPEANFEGTGEADVFSSARLPITNSTQFYLPLPRTLVKPIFLRQSFPSQVNTELGLLPVGGDLMLFGLQLEYAFNDRLSLTAFKDGYADLEPDATLGSDDGFANLAAGLKYVLIHKPDSQYVLSGYAGLELPTGEDEVFQGTGDGSLNLILSELKLYVDWQFTGALGIHLPFNDDVESTTGFLSAHAGYNLTDRIYPLVELNCYHVFSEGDGGERFSKQVGGAVPSVVRFEGGDLLNLGASHAKDIMQLQ